MKKKNNRKGFTLAELLIVVAIIAVLVAIAIPIFTSQLERSREATDAANIRSAYAEVVADALTDGTEDVSREVQLRQSVDGWQTSPTPELAGTGLITGTGHVDPTVTGTPAANGKCTVSYNAANGTTAESVTIDFS